MAMKKYFSYIFFSLLSPVKTNGEKIWKIPLICNNENLNRKQQQQQQLMIYKTLNLSRRAETQLPQRKKKLNSLKSHVRIAPTLKAK